MNYLNQREFSVSKEEPKHNTTNERYLQNIHMLFIFSNKNLKIFYIGITEKNVSVLMYLIKI